MASTCLLHISSSVERLPYSAYLGSKSSAPLPLISSLDKLHRPRTHERPPARLAPGRRRAQRWCLTSSSPLLRSSGSVLESILLDADVVRCCDLYCQGHTTGTVLSPTPWRQDDRVRRK